MRAMNELYAVPMVSIKRYATITKLNTIIVQYVHVQKIKSTTS